MNNPQTDQRQQRFTILSLDDIRRLQEESILELSTTLSLSTSDSCSLLDHYKWGISKVLDEYFADENKVRETVGLIRNPVLGRSKTGICNICFEKYPGGNMKSATCGHRYCQHCWRKYIKKSINNGPGCLKLRCPDPSCPVAVGRDTVNSLVLKKDQQKYSRHLIQSYVENSNKKIYWCPAPGCDFAVKFDGESTNFDILCQCGHAFCWNCRQEALRPLDCDQVSKWELKNNTESSNAYWILKNSKPCPQCRRPIQKNGGCMHMTCGACRYQFCWLCLCEYANHNCSNSEQSGKKDEGEEEKRRKRAKLSIDKYTHYWERWASNQKSKKKALKDLRIMKKNKAKKIREKLNLQESELKFVIEAYECIVQCRRVLAWTYAYGYFLDENEKGKKGLLDYLQGEAEANLERLHKCAEIDLQAYHNGGNAGNFDEFRRKLSGLTSATRNHFDNFLGALENGLKEVDNSVGK